jgi:plastocyanin
MLTLLLLLQTGTLSGKVELPPPPKSKIKVRYSGQSGASAKQPPAPSPAVVYLEGVAGDFKPPEKNPEITQEGIEFRPRVVPILKGTTVDFPNRDKVHHNVFSLSEPAKFDLGRYATGESKQFKFENAGVVKVFCEIHEHMKAFVVVLDNPYYATTDETGAYKIENIPPGTYTLVAWHEDGKPVRQPITIPAGAATQDLKFSALLDEPEAVERACCSHGG